MYLILKSPFGNALQAIRDNPQRCEAVGINVRHYQLLGIVIATFFAGLWYNPFLWCIILAPVCYCFSLYRSRGCITSAA